METHFFTVEANGYMKIFVSKKAPRPKPDVRSTREYFIEKIMGI
jgi:hypothetical protein